MHNKKFAVYFEAIQGLKDISLQRELHANSLKMPSLVTNFFDYDGSVTTAWLKAAEIVGERGLTVSCPSKLVAHLPHMRGLWINRWPVDLSKFWEAANGEITYPSLEGRNQR